MVKRVLRRVWGVRLWLLSIVTVRIMLLICGRFRVCTFRESIASILKLDVEGLNARLENLAEIAIGL